MSTRNILNQEDIRRILVRLSHEIVEKNHGIDDVAIVGIRTRGVSLAERICANLKEIEGIEVPFGTLDITLYRDDLGEIGPSPDVKETDLKFNLQDKIIVLVDDVLYTGRTVRSALDALTDYGRPQAIQLAVLVDRGHRELPIKADYVGKNIPTAKDERVILKLQEVDGEDTVIVEEGKNQ